MLPSPEIVMARELRTPLSIACERICPVVVAVEREVIVFCAATLESSIALTSDRTTTENAEYNMSSIRVKPESESMCALRGEKMVGPRQLGR